MIDPDQTGFSLGSTARISPRLGCRWQRIPSFGSPRATRVAELTQLDDFAKVFTALGVKLVPVSSDRVDELRPFKRKQHSRCRPLRFGLS